MHEEPKIFVELNRALLFNLFVRGPNEMNHVFCDLARRRNGFNLASCTDRMALNLVQVCPTDVNPSTIWIVNRSILLLGAFNDKPNECLLLFGRVTHGLVTNDDTFG